MGARTTLRGVKVDWVTKHGFDSGVVVSARNIFNNVANPLGPASAEVGYESGYVEKCLAAGVTKAPVAASS